MSVKARALNTLYKSKRITAEGVRQAVINGLITEAEYEAIVGEPYPTETVCEEPQEGKPTEE
jgi:hypothetical protein